MNVPATLVVAKSPMVTPMSSAPGFTCSSATMAGDSSIPCTRTPRRLSGNAMRPVPMPSSSAAPVPASSARKFTAGSTTAGSNRSGQRSSYRFAIRSSKLSSGIGAPSQERAPKAATELIPRPPVRCAPMTRPGTETVRLIDELTANATAATTVQLVDGWVLRASPEYPFRRCNSVLPYGGNPAGLAARIDLVEDFYRDRDLPARFQMSPAMLPVGLDDALETRGYEIEEPTLVLVAETPRVITQTMRAETGDVTLGEGIDEYWVAEYASAFGDDDAGRDRLRAYAHLLRHLGPAVGTAVLPVDEMPAAVGLGVLERGWTGVYAMGTRREARRRGAATSILHALARWGHSRDAARMYLQVEAMNDGARQLYTRAGFEMAYRYHYRTSA